MPNLPRTLSVTFHLTHNCNLRCGYCFTGEKFGAGMSLETADQAVRFALDETRRQEADHLEIIFFGGEPLMRYDLLCHICDQLRQSPSELRVSFKTSTNGLLLSEDVLRGLTEREVYISLSLDGDPDTQDAQRPDQLGRGTSQRLAEVIPRLLYWNPCTAVNCVVTPQSAQRLDQSIRWIFDQGFSYVSTAIEYGAPWTWDDLTGLKASYERLAEWYVEQTRAGRKFYLSCFDERIRSRTRGPLDRSERCSIGYRQFSIAPSGRLFPCVQFVQEDANEQFVLGDVWSGFQETRRESVACSAETKRPECGGCVLTERCSSWCACVNWRSTGRLDKTSGFVCEHERMLLEIADRAGNRLWKLRNPLFLHKHYNPAFPVFDFAEKIAIEEDHEFAQKTPV